MNNKNNILTNDLDNKDLNILETINYKYKFTQVNKKEDIKKIFKEINKDFNKLFRFTLICLVIELLTTIFLYSLFILILTIIGFFITLFFVVIMLINNSQQKKQLKSNNINSTEEVELYDEYLVYYYHSIDKNVNISRRYNEFKMFKESDDLLLLYTNDNQIFGFSKSQINNIEIISFIKSKMYENVKTFNGKSINKK